MNKLPLTYEEFKEIYSKVPRLCVEVVIKTEKGVLLKKRKQYGWEGFWHLPGGSVYYREHLHDAVKRIAKEELGVDIMVGEMLGYIEYFSEEKERGFGYSVSIAFLCTPTTDIPENDDTKYFNTLPEKIVEEHINFLKNTLNIGLKI